MKHFRRSRVVWRVCQWVVPALIAPLLLYYAPAAPALAAAAGGTGPQTGGATATSDVTRVPAVIVLDFNNMSGYDGEVVGRSAAAAVAQSMTDSDRWEVLSSNVVNTALTNLNLTPPLDITAMKQLGREADADAIVSGQVYAVSVSDNPKQAKVGVRVEMLDVTTGALINGAVEVAQSGARPGYSGDPQVLIDEALRKAAFQAVTTMTQNRLPQGTVLNTSVTGTGQREVLLNIGAQNGVKEGMEFFVIRNKTQVSRIRITRVDPDQSTAIVVQETQGAQPEDRVTAVFDLPTVSQLRQSSGTGDIVSTPPRARKKGRGLSAALGALLGAALLIFALGGSKKSGRLSGPFGDQPAAQATSLNQGAPVLADAAAVKISWKVPNFVRPVDIIQFQIFRSDVLTAGTTTTTGTAGTIPPIGTVSGNQTVFYDTTQARDVSYYNFAGVVATPTSNNGQGVQALPALATVTVGGLVPGRTVNYSVVMIYQRAETVSGGTTGGNTGTTTGNTGGTNTTGTTSSTTTGTSSGTTGTGSVSSVTIYIQTPVTTTSLVTPLTPPGASSPQGGQIVNPATAVTFDISGSDGANLYMLELSKDPTFSSPVQIQLPIQPTSQQGGAVSAPNVDLTKLFPNYHGTLYWHAGARNSADQPGPDAGRFASLPGDRRWVYSGFETLVIP